MSELELLRVRIIKNEQKIELFKLNSKYKNKITVYHLENENLVLKKLMKNKKEVLNNG